jgi:hypothetical protein
MIRSPISGSPGPNHNQTEEDWQTHREILKECLPPFEDLPGVDPYQMKSRWLDDEMYTLIIKKANERIAKGDVPVNLTATVMLIHGDLSHLDLVRSQMDMLWQLRKDDDGVTKVPNRHFDAGWWDYRIQNAIHPVLVWNISMADEDADRVERGWAPANEKISTQGYVAGSASSQHTAAWYHYIRGRMSSYPVDILKNNLEAMSIHDWQILQPAILEALTHLTLGGPMVSYHGGHLQVKRFANDPTYTQPLTHRKGKVDTL